MGNRRNLDAPRIGFFGGTFDPPHLGHIKIAQQAIELANLEKVFFCPAYHAPLRDLPALFSAEDRLAMIDSICHNHPKMEVCEVEINHGKTRYTHETISELSQKFPAHKFYLIIGEDQFSRLHLWENLEGLAKMVHFLVFSRESQACPTADLPDIEVTFAGNSRIDLSSTIIREQICKGILPQSLLPPEVIFYLKEQNLFSHN